MKAVLGLITSPTRCCDIELELVVVISPPLPTNNGEPAGSEKSHASLIR